ncbi:caspase family protein, partial [Pandoraea communis]
MPMTSLLLRGLTLVLLCASCLSPTLSQAAPAPQPARKVALVVGNSSYDGADRLIAPANDVKLISDTLRQLGFETRVATDVSQEEFRTAVAWLAQASKGAQVSLFYFAGHGFESGGDNFLVPVHAGVPIRAMTRPILLERALRLGYVRSKVMPSAPTSFIAVIDACRVPSRGNAGPGLKPEKVGQGELIAFSTADQAPAYDSMRNFGSFGSAADNSPFAYYLAMNMKTPGATIKHTLDLVQQQVAELTGGQQRPWISSGLIGDVPLGA